MVTEPFSQRDARWSEVLLGNSETATIGSHGCLVTAGAWMAGVRPPLMNDGLRCTMQFRDDVPGALRRPYSFSIPIVTAPVFLRDIGARGEYYDAPYPDIEIQRLLARVALGEPSIVEVRLRRWAANGGGQHFVATSHVADGELFVMDPWFGDIEPLCPRYGRTKAIAICRAIHFERLCAPAGMAEVARSPKGRRRHFKRDKEFSQ